ncbi:MAG: hypothetical protein QG608_529 [Actinomycetota bacterium]|nr:hypothetical protein [Actinomycetota bacterium]
MTQVASESPRRARRENESGKAIACRHHHEEDPADLLSARGRHATPQGQGFGRVVGWTILGSIVPGTGLLIAGRRTAGKVVLGSIGAIVLILGVIALIAGPITLARKMLSNPDSLLMVALVLAVLAAGWSVLIVRTHLSLREYADLTDGQSHLCSLLVVSLIGMVLVPTAQAANYAWVTRETLNSVFDGGDDIAGSGSLDTGAKDPWAAHPRWNVLLIGGDDGKGRTGMRPDTIIMASIDTKTGSVTMFSLPRNLEHVPFPEGTPQAEEYPDGFYCENPEDGINHDCLLNGIWNWADANKAKYYPNEENAGLAATVQAVQTATGLQADDYVMLNLQGFRDFIDAVGKIEINVKQDLPIGGSTSNPVATGWIRKGKQKLDGYNALWYARSRWSSTNGDFDRMRRQRCVISAVVEKAEPKTLALNFTGVMAALKKNLHTSIKTSELDAWTELAMRVKKGKIKSIAFTNNVINPSDPDFDKMRKLVEKALVSQPASTQKTPSAGSGTTPTPKPSASSTGGTSPTTSPEDTEDVKDVCS